MMIEGKGRRSRPVLAVYCRSPESGGVKTRLARTVGKAWARRFHTLCLDLLQKELPFLTDMFDLAVCPSREEDRSWAAKLFPSSHHVVPQVEGNLGERLAASLGDLHALGYEEVLFIGSDAPSLPLPYLRVARRLLRDKDVILGPADDGGVYVIGMRVRVPLLGGIRWGTKSVFGELTETCVRHGFSVGIGPPWYDVDTEDSLGRVAEDLSRSPSLVRKQFGIWIDESVRKEEAMPRHV